MWFFKNREDSSIDCFIKKAAKWDPFEIRKYEGLYDTLLAKKGIAEHRQFGLKLLIISDTHGYLAFDKSRFPSFLDTVGEYDLCLLLGDIHPAEMPIILDCIPIEKIIAVKGNHDVFDIYSKFGVRDISGNSIEYKGVRFVGLDVSFKYKTEPFPSHTQYESLVIANKLPRADILLSHDIMLSNFDREPAHSGLIGITYYIYANSVQWHFHGHIHKSYESEYLNGSREKSVYLCEYVEI